MYGSTVKKLHYHTNGTGRDTYIHSNNGGFMFNYSGKKDYDAFVGDLRGYRGNAHGHRSMKSLTVMQTTYSGKPLAKQDHFVKGQLSPHTNQARNGLAVLKNYQKDQSERLAMPRKISKAQMLGDGTVSQGTSEGLNYLR